MTNPFDLAGEVALVTGGGGGLGRRFCKVLAVNGAHIVVADRSRRAAKRVADDLVRDGHEAITAEIDVIDVQSIAGGFDAAEAAFGTVTIAVGSAGIVAEKSALQITAEEWRATMAVNLDGGWFTAQIAAKRMMEAGTAGAIVNISSILGFKARPGLACYAVSKAGVIQMTKALALELAGSNIRVNAIAPGWFDAGIAADALKSNDGKTMIARVPARRAGSTSELDGALLLLASKASSYMNGSVITVDGGHSLVIP